MPQLALLLTTVIWGATFPATKIALEQMSPLAFLFARFLLGALLVVGVYLALGRQLRLERRLVGPVAVITMLLVAGFITQTVGLRDTTVSNSAFITALYVVFVPLMLRRFEARIWLSAGLALAGLWLLTTPSVSLNVGDVWTLGCAVAFAAYIACLERYARELDPWALFLWQTVFATALLVPALALEPTMGGITTLSALLVALFITGVLATAAMAVQIWAQRHLPAQRVALLFALEPVFAAWFGWLLFDERFGPAGWLGSGLILAAVVLGALATDDRLPAPVPSTSLSTNS
jgi:drug/metabolite transporter (DMT)-like permease